MALNFNGKFTVNGRFSYGKSNISAPVWVTNSGSLGIYDVGGAIDFQFQATDSTAVTYTVLPGYGSLPANLTLSSAGVLSGTFAGLGTTTIFNNIRIAATNRYNLTSYITVSITVDVVVSLTCDETHVTVDSTNNIASATAII
jgi:hypothetical protein